MWSTFWNFVPVFSEMWLIYRISIFFYQKFAQFRNCFSKTPWRRAISLIYFWREVNGVSLMWSTFWNFVPVFSKMWLIYRISMFFIKNLLSLGIVSQRHHGGELYHLYIFEGSWMVFRWCGVLFGICPTFSCKSTKLSVLY